jgi:hypothetical protein
VRRVFNTIQRVLREFDKLKEERKPLYMKQSRQGGDQQVAERSGCKQCVPHRKESCRELHVHTEDFGLLTL